ncbi:MAG: hypothetical protein K6T31_08210 [Alicyclobacillus sp.]|nr:hypothetical protein [Alicyclobacillus sp.]
MLFHVGKVKISPAVLSSSIPPDDLIAAFGRHIRGDWGEAAEAANDLALVNGERVVSTYTSANGLSFCICTEDGVTQVTFPHELWRPVQPVRPTAVPARYSR